MRSGVKSVLLPLGMPTSPRLHALPKISLWAAKDKLRIFVEEAIDSRWVRHEALARYSHLNPLASVPAMGHVCNHRQLE